MSEARAYIRKLVRMRKHLNKQGLSGKNVMATERAMRALINWLEFFPNASDAQVRRFIERHLNEVELIMPGENSRSFESLNQQLISLIYGSENNN